MTAHKSKVGERVLYQAPRKLGGASVATVLRLFPHEDQNLTYRIKSEKESCERMVRETELTSLQEDT